MFKRQTSATHRKLAPAAWFFLAATAVIALLWSHNKLLWFDELIELQTDGVGSVREVLRIQRTFPISLDPALYHVLTHGYTRILGVTAFGMRLPALLGFLLTQACLYLFVRRIAGTFAGVVALVLPALSGMLLYAAEARPYGLLYGLYGVAIVAYQAATRTQTLRKRRAALIALALAIGCAINLNWFGFLVLAPLCAAEAVRSIQSRHIDGPLLAAGTIGTAGAGLALPFHAGVARYGLHYYADGTVTLHTLTLCYRVLFLSDLQVGNALQKLLMAALLLLMAATVAAVLRNRRSGTIHLPHNELALLFALALLPFFGFVLALVATHTMAIRYVFSAGIGIAALLACAAAPLLETRQAQRAALAVLCLALAGMGWFHIHRERLKSATLLQQMQFTPAVTQALHNAPGDAIYMANVFPYASFTWYTPDPLVRSRLTLLYSYEQELALRGRDTNALTADHMRHFTGHPVARYEDLRARGGHAIIVISPDRWWDWTPDALARDGAALRLVGEAYGGTVYDVAFPTPARAPRAEAAP